MPPCSVFSYLPYPHELQLGARLLALRAPLLAVLALEKQQPAKTPGCESVTTAEDC